MFFLKKLASALVLPPMGPVLLALLGLWVARRHRRTGTAIAATALLCLVVLSLPAVSKALVRSLEDYPPLTIERLGEVQAIVVLGGGIYSAAPEYGMDTVGGKTLERIRYAAWLHRRQPLPILVTGGAPVGGKPEAGAMQEVLEKEFQVPVRWVEAQSKDTVENARLSAEILRSAGIQRIALVSHGWHLPRAMALFAAQGLTVVAAPTVFTTQVLTWETRWLPSAGALAESSTALAERLGRLVQVSWRPTTPPSPAPAR